MIAKKLTTAFVIVFSVLQCSAEIIEHDSTSSKVTDRTGLTALRFGIYPDRLLQTCGLKYWTSDEIAISGHLMGALGRSNEKTGTTFLRVLDFTTYGGVYLQGEYHWLIRSKVLFPIISPYCAAGFGVGIAQSPSLLFGSFLSEATSWFIVGSLLIGAEIFLTPSLSIALEQGVDISYEQQRIFNPQEPFISLLPFSKARNNKLLLHIYF